MMEHTNLKELQNGDVLCIEGKTFEVLYVQREAEPCPGQTPPVRVFLAVHLHSSKSLSLEPTHWLRLYEDTQELVFVSHDSRSVLDPSLVVRQ